MREINFNVVNRFEEDGLQKKQGRWLVEDFRLGLVPPSLELQQLGHVVVEVSEPPAERDTRSSDSGGGREAPALEEVSKPAGRLLPLLLQHLERPLMVGLTTTIAYRSSSTNVLTMFSKAACRAPCVEYPGSTLNRLISLIRHFATLINLS